MYERKSDNRYDELGERGGKIIREPRRRNLISYSLFIGLEIILLGVILFLWAQDVLSEKETLAYFLLGLGGIFFFDTMARYARLGPRTFMWCRITISLIVLSAGGAVLGGIGTWWPLIIILVGVGLLLNSLLNFLRNK
jgi:hypothetical protein